MIRHDYAGCGTCHADPSGGGPLTQYGRAAGDMLMRTNYGGQSDEPSASAGFLYGAVEPPPWLLAGGDIRAMVLSTKPGDAPLSTTFVLMQADLRAAVVADQFRAGASVGLVSTEGSSASISGGLVSREYWLGYSFAHDQFLLRAGRLNVPFGLRQVEHSLFVRRATRTDLNDTQQHGLTLAYSGEHFRGEVMAILGNYQISPDAYRQRGYSAYAEASINERLAVGLSSLVTRAEEDQIYHVGNLRQAHGLFGRYAPVRPLVLLGELDLVVNGLDNTKALTGYAATLQADFEPLQGIHLLATGETMHSGLAGEGASYGLGGGVNWYFLPHTDLRIDVAYQRLAVGATFLDVSAYMFQLHTYL